MDEARQKAFKKLLEEEHEWPGPYDFKFIVPSEQIDMISNLLPNVELTTRFSGKGKFTSVSFQIQCESPNDVVDIYIRVKNVPGLMAL
ncbi:DUF493 domain-containing protein [bacterium]|nr:DUF493 domain-containing protein [bacterium]